MKHFCFNKSREDCRKLPSRMLIGDGCTEMMMSASKKMKYIAYGKDLRALGEM